MARVTKEEPSTVTISDFFRYLATAEQGGEARKVYCGAIEVLIGNLSAWLGVDAWLGAGDTTETSKKDHPPIDPERRRGFIAAGLVAQMSAQLIKGSVLLLREGNEYASAGLMRQLIECEYLFRAFQLNFADATKWLDAPPSAKHDFSPRNLRQIGGFDHEEYSNHCESGGHPRAAGQHLLQLPRLMQDLENKVAGRPLTGDDMNGMLWMDLALHCERTWKALTNLLLHEHARFDVVRAGAMQEAKEAHEAWLEADPLARQIGPILGIMAVDPETPLNEVINKKE
jgi:hypothetical protein